MIKRIALLSLHTSPLAQLGTADAGGMNLYVRRLADHLSAPGVQVDVFTRRNAAHQPFITRTEGGARVIHLSAGAARPFPKSGLLLHVPAFVDALQAFAHDEGIGYDLIHSHYWLSGLAALRARTYFDAPIIHMFHTLARAKEFYCGGADPRDSSLRADGEQRIIEGADAIVGATDAEREIMERLYRRTPSNYCVIPPGVDLRLFRPHDRDGSRLALHIHADRVILFAGRLNRIKGLDLLLRSVADLAPALTHGLKVVVVGDHDGDEGARRYHSTITRLGLSKIVEFRGVVPQSELPLYYSAADVCAVPSAYESFGMVAVEAMACETPVVAFRVGGLATTVHDGHTGFLARPGIASDFTARLALALRHPDLPAIGQRARLSVWRYDWSSIGPRTMDVYRYVLGEHRWAAQRVIGAL